jgi:hypothetical protein
VLATLAEFADDSAAQIGGVARYGFYHTAGVVKTRIQADLNAAYAFTQPSYMYLPNGAFIGRAAWTLEMWILQNAPVTSDVYHLYDNRAISTAGQSSQGVILAVFPDGALSAINTEEGSWYRSTSSLPLNVWTHVAMVRDGAQLRLYIGGQPRGSFGINSSKWTNITPDNVVLGNVSVYSARDGWDGSISQCRISASALYTTSFTPARTLASAGSLFCLGASAKNSVDGRTMTVYGQVTQGFLPAA